MEVKLFIQFAVVDPRTREDAQSVTQTVEE